MLTKRKQQTEKRKGAGVISGKNIKVPHPHHKNKILKLLNDLHTLSNAVNKKILAAALHSDVVTVRMQQHQRMKTNGLLQTPALCTSIYNSKLYRKVE